MLTFENFCQAARTHASTHTHTHTHTHTTDKQAQNSETDMISQIPDKTIN
jgi:hypothetical protein